MPFTERQRAFLEEVHFAVVATIGQDGVPHQTVMWYVLDGEDLLLNTPFDSLKHRHLKRDQRLSVCIEDAYRYITLSGTVRLDEDPVRARRDYQRLGARYAGTFNLVERSANSGEAPEILRRERVNLHMHVEKILSSGLD